MCKVNEEEIKLAIYNKNSGKFEEKDSIDLDECSLTLSEIKSSGLESYIFK